MHAHSSEYSSVSGFWQRKSVGLACMLTHGWLQGSCAVVPTQIGHVSAWSTYALPAFQSAKAADTAPSASGCELDRALWALLRCSSTKCVILDHEIVSPQLLASATAAANGPPRSCTALAASLAFGQSRRARESGADTCCAFPSAASTAADCAPTAIPGQHGSLLTPFVIPHIASSALSDSNEVHAEPWGHEGKMQSSNLKAV